jgi:polyhydroxyalkanoate synthesis repressor PhaR
MEADVRVIKRYANRKLYDTGRSCYITLDDIARMIKQGEEIRIIDNRSKEDLTSVTLAQILVEEQRRQKKKPEKDRTGKPAMPTIRDLIEHSGELIQRTISEPVNQLRTDIEDSVHRVIRTGEERALGTRQQLQAWFDQRTAALEEIQDHVDERVKVMTASLRIIGDLQAQISVLEDRVAALEDRLNEGRGRGEGGTRADGDPPGDQ